MKEALGIPRQPHSSSEAEIQHVREGLQQAQESAPKQEHEQIARQYVESYANQQSKDVIDESLQVSTENINQVVLSLAPEAHDIKMQELIAYTKEKGVKNALALVAKMEDAHIEDDFHRFLVEYLREGYPLPDVKEKSNLSKMLNMSLFEITLPASFSEEDQKMQLAMMLSSMEQFYAGMLSIAGKDNVGQSYFTLEVAIPNFHEEFTFFAAISSDKKDFFEKHVTSSFSEARLSEIHDDYNIFNESGVSVGAVANFSTDPIFPLKTYDQFDRDPLNGILNSMSKIEKEGEGAAIQIIFNPLGAEAISKKYQNALEKLQKGVSKKEALDISYTTGQEVTKELKKTFRSFMSKDKKKQQTESLTEEKDIENNQDSIELIKQKVSAPLFKTNIRLLASSATESKSNAILADMQSAFNQFENAQGGKLVFKKQTGRAFRKLSHDFSFRLYHEKQAIPLNVKELTTLMHFHTAGLSSAPQLKKSLTAEVSAPTSLSQEGIKIGVNKARGTQRDVRMLPDDRVRHMYVIGQTGTGKSTFIKNMIIQDIQNGEGVCYIDPHGADIEDILASVPKERMNDVIYFDPGDTSRPMGLNMLEYNPEFPEQKTFVVNELFSIFQKLYGGVPESMGPMFEQYFRNATMLVVDDPESGSTLLDVSRVLVDKTYRELKLSRCKNPVVVQFWEKIASQADGEASLQNIVPYITSKFDVFLANDIMRPIIAQQHSAFSFRDIMDQKKILLVNLSKGKLGDINSNLIGLIVVGKILMATLSRADSRSKEFPPFYLYIDEFQNVTTNSISVILSEARKYKLSLNVAHQFIAQLQDDIKNSVFGNVGSMVAFRVGSDDAQYLENQFAPTVKASDLMTIENRNAFAKVLVNGQPVDPFTIVVPPPPAPLSDNIEDIKELSRLTYGRSRQEVESDIMQKYK